MLYYVMNDMNIFDKLVELSPLPEVTTPEHDSVFDCSNIDGENPKMPTINVQVDNNALLEKISALEKMIADMTNKENANNL